MQVQHLKRPPQDDLLTQTPTLKTLLASLEQLVADRCSRLAGVFVAVAGFDFGAEALPQPPVHPCCAGEAVQNGCLAAWRAHVEELQANPRTHWHECGEDRLCAVVPLVYGHQCLAICKLVSPRTIGTEVFVKHVELLELLVENFVAQHQDVLSRLDSAQRRLSFESAKAVLSPVDLSRCHPQVTKALEYIDAHLGSRSLSVAGIARFLGINSTYLAHLFSVQIGVRMSRFIAERRIELAKRLLTDTDWQVKRIAEESGHGNADWFSQVFRTHAGVSPRDYRRQSRSVVALTLNNESKH